MKKLGIYVQVPFCQTKCTYCNFHTGVVASSRFGPYVEAVWREIRGHRQLLRAAGVEWGEGTAHSQGWLCHGAVADTVYIGGGTPSLLEPSQLERILDAICSGFGIDGESEGIGGKKSDVKPPYSKAPAIRSRSGQASGD